jgi:hypothetical protein
MDCLKLTYYQENQLNLKVVWRKPEPGKPVPRFTSVDPLAEKYPWQSTYVYAAGNPIRYIDWMGLGPLGADELTDEEWMETSRPNSDSRMAREYRQQNLAAERAIADLSNFVHGKFKQNPHATVGGLLPGDWDDPVEGKEGGGGRTNWGLYITGAVLTAEDMYNNFRHNHTTYTTLGGEVKNIYKANGAIRSARARQFATTSKVVKWAGIAGTAFMTGVATYNIVDDVSKKIRVSGWDIADGSVGAIGLTGAGLTSVGLISNPVGWGIGAGVATYSWSRLWYDLGTKYGPSKW